MSLKLDMYKFNTKQRTGSKFSSYIYVKNGAQFF